MPNIHSEHETSLSMIILPEESEVEQNLKKPRKKIIKFTDLFTPQKLSIRYTRMRIIRVYCYFVVGQQYTFSELENLTQSQLGIRTTYSDKAKLSTLINDDPGRLTLDWTNFINHFVTDEATKEKFAQVLSPPTLNDMTTWEKNLKIQAPKENDDHIGTANAQQPRKYLAIQNILNNETEVGYSDAIQFINTTPQSIPPRHNQPQTLMELFTPEYLCHSYTRMRIIRLYCYFVVGQQYSLADLETLTPKELHIKTNDTDKDKLLTLINKDPGKLTSDWANFINHFVTDEANKNEFEPILSLPTVKDMTDWKNSNERNNVYKEKRKVITVGEPTPPKKMKHNIAWSLTFLGNPTQASTTISNAPPNPSVSNVSLRHILNDSPQQPTSSGSTFTIFSSPLQRDGNMPKIPSGHPSAFNLFKK